MRKADNRVLEGIRRTAEALRQGKIVICKGCEAAAREFAMYRWENGGAGDRVRKEFDHAMDDMEDEARLGRKYLKSLRREMVRLAGIAEPEAEHALLEKAAAKLDEEELLGFIRLYRQKADRLMVPRPQLCYGEDAVPREIADGAFLI